MLFVICLAVVIFSFSGCSSITYGTLVNQDGSISEVLEVMLDEEKLEEKGIEPQKLFEEIEKEYSVFVYNKTYKKSIEGFDYNLTKDEKNKKITLILNYQDINSYYAFWEANLNDVKSKQDYEFCFLFDKLKIIDDKTVFHNIQNSSIAKHFYDWCELNYGQIEWNSCDFKFNYVYAIPTSFGYQTNAQKVQTIGDTSYHIWQFDLSQTDQNISVFVPLITNRNVACWFILILFLSGVFGLLLYFKFRNK
ncbi:MAG: hypothetical protein IJ837_01220 [Clostridia bacterium]|nr:hypothetical protein [Clostridia bacterium]